MLPHFAQGWGPETGPLWESRCPHCVRTHDLAVQSTTPSLLVSGFPASGKIMETWKMKKTFSRPGKIMEFEKSKKKPGKIMEFEKIYLEKSWNFVSDLKLCESNFSRAARVFQVPIVHAFVHFIVVH